MVYDMQHNTVEWVLHSLFGAEDVFLRKLKPIENEPTKYQFMRKSASKHSCWLLFQTFDRLAVAGVMKPSESVELKRKICRALVDEFAAICPPPEGKKYRFAGIDDERGDHMLMLEIIPATQTNEINKGEE